MNDASRLSGISQKAAKGRYTKVRVAALGFNVARLGLCSHVKFAAGAI
jgi:hypothetical protein